MSKIDDRQWEQAGCPLSMDQIRERDMILHGRMLKYPTGCTEKFHRLEAGAIRSVVEKNYCGYFDGENGADMEFNSAPSINQLLEFEAGHAGLVEFGGYTVSPERSDCRVTVDTVFVHESILRDFIPVFGPGNEFDPIADGWWRVWWD